MDYVIILNDLGLGDQGKGTTIDFLARQYDASAILRTNGGAQALHHVITPDGRLHGFSQFGSGTFVSDDIRTMHGPLMLCSPAHLLDEAKRLKDLGVDRPLSRVTLDERTIIITPWHRAGNWMKELARGDQNHGTCGFGIGETMRDMLDGAPILRAGDLKDAMRTSRLVYQIMQYKQQQYAPLVAQLAKSASPVAQRAIDVLQSTQSRTDFLRHCSDLRTSVSIKTTHEIADDLRLLGGTVLFEGAQGVLLDEWYGFHPHTTWSTTTSKNPLSYLDDLGYEGEVLRLGVLRTYASRHGAGPLMTHDPVLTAQLPEMHNREDGWAGKFRFGWFDAVTGRYAIKANGGVDGLVLTCLDRVADMDTIKYAVGYTYNGAASRDELEQYFDFVGDDIVDMRLPTEPSIDRQKRLTELWQECTPIYAETTPDAFVSAVEAELGVPVRITSYGPTADDKVLLP